MCIQVVSKEEAAEITSRTTAASEENIKRQIFHKAN
jgi:hypothetical protein